MRRGPMGARIPLVFRRSAPDGAEHGTGDPAMGLGGHCPSSSLSGPPPCEQGRLPTVSVGASKKNGLRAAIGRSETFSSIQLLSHGILIIGDSAGDFLRFRMDYKTNGSLYVMRKVFESFRSYGIILAFPEVQIAARLSLSMSLSMIYSWAVRICSRKF